MKFVAIPVIALLLAGCSSFGTCGTLTVASLADDGTVKMEKVPQRCAAPAPAQSIYTLGPNPARR